MAVQGRKDMVENACLIIMAKPPVLGKAKSRLAATVGDEKALEVYQKLLDYTWVMASSADIDVHVFFTETHAYTEQFEQFPSSIQCDGDLGERMHDAVRKMFDMRYSRVIVIGADCPELTTGDIQQSLQELEQHDIVIGPAVDGGYYLIGMKEVHDFLFEEKPWSQPELFRMTMEDIDAHGCLASVLETKRDIDDEEDLRALEHHLVLRVK